MGAIEEVYADLDTDVSEEEFREAVEQKVEQMGGLADEETAAMLIAHELNEGEVDTVADIEPGMEEVKFLAKVVSIGELRTFERDGEDEDGRVVNVEAADETGNVRLAFWDKEAEAITEGMLEEGQVLRIAGRPKDGYNGLEVSVDKAEPDDDAEIDVELGDGSTVDALTMGQSDVNVRGIVLETDSIRTFDRDDGSEGKVSNLLLGDETGRVRVTMWDDRADRATELDPGTAVEVVDGYVREREGDLELHVGDHGAIDEIDETVEFTPEADAIGSVEMDQVVDLAGVVRSADPKRTFDRDDGSEGQVRNIRVQDDTGDIRVALWGEKADKEIAPGDEVFVADAEIQDGWQDDLEASAGWQSTVVVLDEDTGAGSAAPSPGGAGGASGGDSGSGDSSGADAGLGAFTGEGDADGGTADASDAGGSAGAASGGSADGGAAAAAAEEVEFTGTVVQTGDPVILDDGQETMQVETDAALTLGQEVTARGAVVDDRLDADDVF
ncbi:single-stranded DNA binding protein [Halosimplex pelagicum]|uniref:Single-stranded DNA binding protein n=1 Tax=Halosimplex pelagicum TaxID=869886 RepID=A0A7D5PCE2_9EURY|nr:single-stranded DNA binding protein [Halosimplex pelagicum]QLH84584.1 single-stranded DNA binding protein [Halosimplex pelagicum]